MVKEEHSGDSSLPDEIKERIKERIVPFGFSLGAIAVGAFLLIDDAGDFGDFSTVSHPSWVHHWWIGLLVMLLGLILLLIVLFWDYEEVEEEWSVRE